MTWSREKKRWNDEEVAQLICFVDNEDREWCDIGTYFGVSPYACRVRYQRAMRDQGKIPRNHVAESFKVSPEMLADRDARQDASYRRTQTQVFFGDPPPGYSALDKKRAEARS